MAKKSKTEVAGAVIAALVVDAGLLFAGGWVIMLILGAILPALGAGYLLVVGLLYCLSLTVGITFGTRLEGVKRTIRELKKPEPTGYVLSDSAATFVDIERAARRNATSRVGNR